MGILGRFGLSFWDASFPPLLSPPNRATYKSAPFSRGLRVRSNTLVVFAPARPTGFREGVNFGIDLSGGFLTCFYVALVLEFRIASLTYVIRIIGLLHRGMVIRSFDDLLGLSWVCI